MKTKKPKQKKEIFKPTKFIGYTPPSPQQPQTPSAESTRMDKPQTEPIPCIMLRRCPPALYERIGKMKMEIMQNNKFRGKVSNEEAIYKMLEKCGE